MFIYYHCISEPVPGEIESCIPDETTTAVVTTAASALTTAAIPTTGCKTTAQGREYNGTLSTTKSGHTCQQWDVNTPHR